MPNNRRIIRNATTVRIFKDGSWEYTDPKAPYNPDETREHANELLINATEQRINELATNYNWKTESWNISDSLRKIPCSIICPELIEYVLASK